MTQFVIEKVQDGDTLPPNAPGLRHTIELPDPPQGLKTWGDLIHWFSRNPSVPYTFHLTVVALARAFYDPPKP